MKVYCISLPERSDLREKHAEVKKYFGDDFTFFVKDRNIRSIHDIDRLIKEGQVSINFSGGRKKFSSLIGEFDAWTKHFELWKNITEPSIIFEDGTIFDVEKFNENDFGDYELVFCDKDWKMEKTSLGKEVLTGHNANYYVTPSGAKKLIEICKNLPIPMDLHIRNCMNLPNNTMKFKVAEPPFISRNPNIKHSIQSSFNVNDVNDKQCFRPLFERLYNIKKPKLAIVASHPSLGTGYANIATQIANNMVNLFDVVYLGFQSITGTVENRDIDPRVKVYDLYKLDPESPMGFGDKAILPTIEQEQPDVVMVYNDVGVVSSVFKLIASYSCIKTTYIDMVYEFQNFDQIAEVIKLVDYVFTFCQFWKDYLISVYGKNTDISNKCHVLYHGLMKFDETELLGRDHFNYTDDAFVVLNMNRNSNRKNLDITIRAFLMFLAELHKKNEDISKVFLQLNCHLCTKDGLHIPNVILAEVLRLGLSQEFIKQIMISSKGHSLSEYEAHSMYNACDVGISTSSGEGFGLTPIEHAQYNKQIVVGNIPTFNEFLDTPYKVAPYDATYDMGIIGGLAYKFKADEFVKCLLDAYDNRKTPKVAKIKNTEKLNWRTNCENFYNIVV